MVNLIEDPIEIKQLLKDQDTGVNGPDLIILGNDLALVPMVHESNNNQLRYSSPFVNDEKSENEEKLLMMEMTGLAYGFGLASLMYALQFIKLGTIPWEKVLGEALTSSIERSNERKKMSE